MYKSHSLWHYSLFQIPALLSAGCLVLAGVAAFLGFGCPSFWVRLFLGLSWVAFTWMLVLPLDNFLRLKLNIGMGLTGRLAFLQAIFWSVATLVILIAVLPPLMKSCTNITSQQTFPILSPSLSPTPTPSLSPTPTPSLSPIPTPISTPIPSLSSDPSISPSPILIPSATPTPIEQELVSLDWRRWRANIWNQMFLDQPLLGPIGSTAEYSFVVYRDGHIEDIRVKTNPDDQLLEETVISRIESLEGTDALVFIKSSRHDRYKVSETVTVCTPSSIPGCGQPADPNNYDDEEKYSRPKS